MSGGRVLGGGIRVDLGGTCQRYVYIASGELFFFVVFFALTSVLVLFTRALLDMARLWTVDLRVGLQPSMLGEPTRQEKRLAVFHHICCIPSNGSMYLHFILYNRSVST